MARCCNDQRRHMCNLLLRRAAGIDDDDDDDDAGSCGDCPVCCRNGREGIDGFHVADIAA